MRQARSLVQAGWAMIVIAARDASLAWRGPVKRVDRNANGIIAE